MPQRLHVLLFLAAFLASSLNPAPTADVTIEGRIYESDTRHLLPNIRLDVIDVASGDTLAGGVMSDSLGRFSSVISVTSTGINRYGDTELRLEQPYPSPADRGLVRVRYGGRSIERGRPDLEVFDVVGRRVGSAMLSASGVYFMRLRFPDGVVTNTEPFVKLSGELVTFDVAASTFPEEKPDTFGKRSSQQSLQLVFSHPAYVTSTALYDSSEDLSDLSVDLSGVFETVTADQETYNVTYDADAIIIENAARSALVEADTVNHQYRFDTAALNAAGVSLVEGKAMMIEGVALRRITGLSEDGALTIVDTDFAPITDVIQSGTIGWQHTANIDASALRKATVGGKAGTIDAQGNELMFAYKAGPYDYKIKIETSPSDSVETKMTVQVTKKIDNNLKATFVGTGQLKQFESTGNIAIDNNETQALNLENKNVRIEMDLTLAAAGSGLDNLSWKMPEVAVPIKFTVGPIPVTLKVIVQVVLVMKVQNEASATASTKLSYDGTTGFEYNGTDVMINHQTINHLLGSTDTDAGSGIGNLVDANLGIAFPRVTVQVFSVPIVPSFLVGFVVGSKLSWGPVCKSGFVSAEVKAAVDLKFFNLTHKLAEAELWKERKDSPPC